jgi:hypothetical protein
MEPTSTKKIEKSYYLEIWWPSHHSLIALSEAEFSRFLSDDKMSLKSYWINRSQGGRVIKKIHICLNKALHFNLFEHEGNPLEESSAYDNPLN